ncbi:PREDICTED: uncharacterized protein LOC109115758 [Nelumbo nucifera]|uniref:UDP-N-acetylmuramate dehydrogenase n=2 Tax=Nelumbo nucifera TaxID=4432 RepID=A0A822ZH04_NELNU|nr:PREDICTED: uncharacterized protein LOC109115758 [Nelumbo nucifera]DAD42739.1 TPA_asm: hypothetical protein HUJ06_000969 [Nelumbo nucifera]
MDVGANGQENVDAIDTVEIITVDGRHQILYRSDLAFGYRMSPFQAMQDLAAIVSVTFRLLPSALANERQQAYLRKRRWSQSVRERTTGSVFRNPPGKGASAGELIEKARLKGFKVDSAEVSKVHANFSINTSFRCQNHVGIKWQNDNCSHRERRKKERIMAMGSAMHRRCSRA